MIRTTVPADALSAEGAVRAYKRLSKVERTLRTPQSVLLKMGPVYHRLTDRVRGHMLVCMLADLATIAKNRLRLQTPGGATFDMITNPTALQQRASDLLQVSHRM